VKKWINIRIIVSGLLIFLIALLIINNSLFIHVHTLSTGEVITHAHPFFPKSESGDPLKQHSHSKNEIQIYSILNSAIFILILIFLIDAIIDYIIAYKTLFYNSILPSANVFGFFNRPPPVLLYV